VGNLLKEKFGIEEKLVGKAFQGFWYNWKVEEEAQAEFINFRAEFKVSNCF
jgi:hypothetical protein